MVSKKVTRCETVCEPVTRCKKVKVCVPCTKQVCTYECVTKQSSARSPAPGA